MRRRDFLKYSSALSTVPFILKGQTLYAISENLFLSSLTSLRSDRKLILIQLDGGNDGLATFVPLDQYANLAKARNNIIVPESKLTSLTDTIGLHPAFAGVKSIFDEEKMLLIQGVGYPQPNLSHFRSKDIITSGSSSDIVIQSGWMGRMLNQVHPDYPEGYPGANYPDPIALNIGSSSSPTCQGYTSSLGMVIKNLSTSYTAPLQSSSYPETHFGKEMKYIEGIMKQTQAYLERIGEAAENTENLSAHYPEEGENSLADQLKIVARLISGGLQTQVFVVNLGGWDTHSGQAEDGVPEGGKHKVLLGKLSEALVAFQDDLTLLGVEDDVLGFVYSEFGRRIKSNDSFGTDHGTSWPAVLFGSKVNPVVMGANPVIAEQVEKQDNLPMQYDFRSLYASIFNKWFEADEELIRDVLYDDFEVLPILKEEEVIENVKQQENRLFKVSPNPVKDKIQVKTEIHSQGARFELFSAGGQQLFVFPENTLTPGAAEFKIDMSGFPAGSYFLVLKDGSHASSTQIVKQ